MLAWAAMETRALDDKWALPGVSRESDGASPTGPVAATKSVAAPKPVAAEPPAEPKKAPPEKPAVRAGGLNLFSLGVGVVGLAALGVSLWVYADTQRELKRVSTDIAQIRVSLELFGKQAGGAATSTNSADLADIANRLALLEANQRLGGTAGAAPSALPALASEPSAAASNSGDCLPSGTRFMVTAGDSYPVCGTSGAVSIAAVDSGFITLGDGTVIAEGATIGLPGTQCMVGVLPSEGDAITGFAEIRVTC